MAIRSRYTTPSQSQTPATSVSSFSATGLGLNVNKPDFAADASNANGSLTQTGFKAPAGRSWLEKIYLFVDSIESGYNLAGVTGQAHTSRSFYPHSLSQDSLIIKGQMTNQFEYDKLVEFVQNHHPFILKNTTELITKGDQFDPVQVRKVVFRLFPREGNTYHHLVPVTLDVVIERMDAGHERFMFAPAFTLTCKVVWDYLDPQDVQTAIHALGNISTVYGAHPISFGPGGTDPGGPPQPPDRR